VIGIETIDLNGDALPDLMLSVTNGGSHGEFYQVPYLQLLVNDGNGQFHDETQARLPQSKTKAPGAANDWYLSSTAIDLNGDSFQDIVVDDAGGGPSKVYLNDGTGNFTKGWESALGTHILAADVDGDGRPDLIESSSAGYSVLYNVFPFRIPASHVYRASERGDDVAGSAAVETVYGGKGNDSVDGGAGLDTMIFSGNRAGYTVLKSASGHTVTGAGTDSLANVERIKFADADLALDVLGSGGQAYRLYQAAFNRAPDASGLGYQMWSMDTAGLSLAQVAQTFIVSKEFSDTYGSLSNEQFVTQLYANVLRRTPDAAGLKYHVDLLNAKTITRADDLVIFSESAENQAALIDTIGNGFAYIPWG
jgi:hypothetical protein